MPGIDRMPSAGKGVEEIRVTETRSRMTSLNVSGQDEALPQMEAKSG